MMRKPALAVALATLIAPAALAAQDARVQSGEHETFSRLVFYLPEAAEFEIERGERSFTIGFSGKPNFDTSTVFYYIPRKRIRDMSSAGGRLTLDLDCDCAVTVERLSGQIVYLDVNDPDTVDVADAEPQNPGLPSVFAPMIIAEAPRAVLPPWYEMRRTASLLPGGLDVSESEESPVEEPVLEAQMLGAADAIAQQIARAATQGLIELDPNFLKPKDEEVSPRETAERSFVAPQIDADGDAARHIAISSSLDQALGADLRTALADLGRSGSCLSDELFDVESWAPNGVAGIWVMRRNLVGEFDRPDPEAIKALARAYIALSFGAEARATLTSFRVNIPDSDILITMAEIVDEGRATSPGRLANQYACPGTSALWAALASPRIPDAAELHPDVVTLTFSALPARLRTHLGPLLAERLLDYGAVDTATVVRNAILRAPGTPNVDTEILEAQIALKTGRKEEADAKLEAVVEETSGRSAEAVIRLMRLRLAAGEQIENDVLVAADALIFEHRGSPLALTLTELRVEGLAMSGHTQGALALLAEAEAQLPGATVARLRGTSYYEGAARLQDVDFLLVAVNAASELGKTPKEMAARRAVARRLEQMQLIGLAATLEVESGEGAALEASEPEATRLPLDLGEPVPPGEMTLKRTAQLVEHSAEIRARLAASLGASLQ